ncbi:MAG: hypothetical protein ACPGRP_01850 [Flavobacteriaceae bacterium]
MEHYYFKASETLRNEFLKYPETGMGYQILSFRNDYKLIPQYYLILNCEFFATLDHSAQMLEDLKGVNFNVPLYSQKTCLVRLNEVSDIQGHYNNSDQEYSLPAKENPKQKADGRMKFVRLSPFQNDFRIDRKNRCLLPGTYTTTYQDYCECKETLCNPVSRYALPSNNEVKWEFHVTPKEGDEFRLGKVRPANGQPGGGVEALFDDGTSKNTLTLVREFKRYEKC